MRREGKLKYVIVFVVSVISFIYLLHFVDFFNIQMFLQISSYLYLSQNPYAFFPNQFPPNYFAFLLPNFILYLYSHNNIYASIFFLKSFQLFISILAAYVIYHTIFAATRDKQRAKLSFLAFLFSPVIFWVNFFQLEQSPVGIFFAVLAVYFLIVSMSKRKSHFLELLAGSILLVYASYVYIIPVVIIPVILIYQKSLRNFLYTLFALVIGFMMFYIPYLLLHGFDLIFGTAAIATSGSGASVGFTIIGLIGPHIYPVDVYQLMLKSIFEKIFIVSIFIVPAVMRRFNIDNIFIPILTNVSMVFLFITISNLDEFSWLVPFVILAFSVSMRERKLLWKLILIQLYDIPYIVLFLIDGSDFNLNGSGIFYLGYLQFHKNIDLDLQWWAPMVNRILIALGFAAIVLLLSMAILLWRRSQGKFDPSGSNGGPNDRNYVLDNADEARSSSVRPMGLKRNKTIRAANMIFILSLCSIFVLSIVPIHVFNNEVNISTPENPVGLFTSQPIMGSSTTYKYIDDYKSLYVFPSNSTWIYGPNAPFYFSRNVTGENVLLNMSIESLLSNVTPAFDYSVFSLGNLSLNLLNVPTFPNDSSPLSPFLTENTSIVSSDKSTLYVPTKIPIYSFGGDSVVEYHLNRSELLNKTFGFIFHLRKANWTNQIIYLKYNHQLFQIFNPPGSDEIILAYSNSRNWTTIRAYSALQQWNSVEFKLTNNALEVNINGNGFIQTNFSVNENGNSTISIGKDFYYSVFNYRYALKGEASALFVLPKGSISFDNLYLEISNNSKAVFSPYVKEYVVLNKTRNLVSIETNGVNFSSHIISALMKFGRIGISPVPTLFEINSIEIYSYTNSQYLFSYIIMIYLPPIAAIGFLSFKNRKQFSKIEE